MMLLDCSRSGKRTSVLLGFVGILVIATVGMCRADPTGRKIEILNDSGRNVVVEWVNPKNGQLVTLSQPHLDNGAKISFDSYVNHTFMIHEPTNGTCSSYEEEAAGSCTAKFITVSDKAQQCK